MRGLHVERTLALITLMATGCGSAATLAGAEHPGEVASTSGCASPPSGTEVTAGVTPDGAVLELRTGGDVETLAAWAHHEAEMHNQHHSSAATHRPISGHGTATHGPGASHSEGHHGSSGYGREHHHTGMVEATARAESFDGGARLVLRPRDPDDLAELRAHVDERAEFLASGRGCVWADPEGSPSPPATRERSRWSIPDWSLFSF